MHYRRASDRNDSGQKGRRRGYRLNDNDFGIVGDPNNPPPTNLWSIRLENQLPLGK